MSGRTAAQTFARIFRMNRDEIRTRLYQQIRKRADEIRYRAGLSPAEEPVGGTAGPAARFFFAPEHVSELVRTLRERLPDEVARTVERADKVRSRRFDLLGYENLDFGDPIDWHADPAHGVRAPRKAWFRIPFLDFRTVGDHKVVWELNRHQHFITLAKAWLFTGEDRYVDDLAAQWRDWHEQNPYPVGINWASSLEVAFRSLSWLWVYHLLAGCTALPEPFRDDLATALGGNARHIERYLSTYFAPNTHLLGEAVALFFIGTLCPQFVSAPRWRQKGWDLVLQESRRQVRADGMHFEQSVYYHVYALDFFLHARVLASRNGVVIPPELDETIEKMAELLGGLSQAGVPPRFGDDDGGRVFDPCRNRTEHLLDPLSTAAVLYGRGDFKVTAGELREETIWLMGREGINRFDELAAATPQPGSRAFEAGGLYVMVSAEPVLRQVTIDAGPFGAFTGGHSHADALSLQLSAQGREWLTDPGTCCYPDQLPERNRFRGTAAHNTLQVDGRDQAEPAGPFAWRNLPESRAERWVAGKTFDLFVGSHDGYRRLAQPALHRRWVVSWKPGGVLVRDVVTGQGIHDLGQFWRLDPAFRLDCLERNLTVFSRPDGEVLTLATPEGQGWSREIQEGEWSAVYGHKTGALAVRYSIRTPLPAELAVSVLPSHGAPPRRTERMERLPGGAGVSVYRLTDAHGSRMLWFSDEGLRWQWQDWTSDAAFLSLRAAQEAGARQLCLAGGSYVEVAGRRILTCSREIAHWECSRSGTRTEMVSSDDSLIEQFDSGILSSLPDRQPDG